MSVDKTFSRKWLVVVILALTVLVSVGVLVLLGQKSDTPSGLKPPVLIDSHQPPTLSVDKPLSDLGAIPMEEPAVSRFTLTNTGGEVLVIKNVETSCGCTVAKLEKMQLTPGESTELTLTLDTSIKLGPVIKTIDVFSNDPVHPKTVLTLKAVVLVPKGQEGMAGPIKVKDPLVLFKGQCKTCHVDKGIDKTGQQLFLADCGMCHGPDGEGGVAPALLSLDLSKPSVQRYVRGIIANGSPTSPTMPPYSQAKGGPLSKGQMDSLVTFLTYQHEAFKAGRLKPGVKDAEHHAHSVP